MKKIISLSIILVMTILCSTTTVAWADAMYKLKKGANEFITAPLELGQKTAYYTDSTFDKPLGVVAGLIEGTGSMFYKAVSGLANIFTFPFSGSS